MWVRWETKHSAFTGPRKETLFCFPLPLFNIKALCPPSRIFSSSAVMAICSHCAGKVSGIGKRTYMVILLQPRDLEGILLEVRILCVSILLKSGISKVLHVLSKSALYSGQLACEILKRYVCFNVY